MASRASAARRRRKLETIGILMVVAVAVALASCDIGPVEVVRVDIRHYKVVDSSVTTPFGAVEKFQLVSRANHYCRRQGKQANPVGFESGHSPDAMAQVVFSCHYAKISDYFFR